MIFQIGDIIKAWYTDKGEEKYSVAIVVDVCKKTGTYTVSEIHTNLYSYFPERIDCELKSNECVTYKKITKDELTALVL